MLTLTAKDLKREAAHALHTVGTGGAAAAAGAIAGHTLCANSRSAFMPLGVAAGGAFVAMKTRGQFLPYAGVGIAVGAVWSLFDKTPPGRRGGW